MTVSESTLAWERWRARRQTRRRWLAWSGSWAFAALIVALVAWGGFPAVFNVGEKGEAVAVKLGNPDGEDLPLSVSAVPDQAMQAVMSAQREAARTTVEETRAVDVTAPGPAPAPLPTKPSTSKPDPAPSPTPTTKPPMPASEKTVTEKVIRGSEKGNASELILKPQGEKISQNVYYPVYLFMPLPTKLDAGLLARVKGSELFSADERRALLLQVYSKSADGLTLAKDPGWEVRAATWQILEAAGYDLANAEYKKGKALKPVIISFQIGLPDPNSGNPPLLGVKLEQSSGSGPVDEAVLYAFQHSSFANGTGQQAQGRYTYDFAAQK